MFTYDLARHMPDTWDNSSIQAELDIHAFDMQIAQGRNSIVRSEIWFCAGYYRVTNISGYTLQFGLYSPRKQFYDVFMEVKIIVYLFFLYFKQSYN